MKPVKDDAPLYEVERRAEHAARPGLRILALRGIGEHDFVPLLETRR